MGGFFILNNWLYVLFIMLKCDIIMKDLIDKGRVKWTIKN